VRRPFDVQSRQLDQILKDRLAGTPVTYISMRDQQICSGVFHEPDGVHLTMKGYRYMWQKTENAVSWPRLASADAGEAVASPPARVDPSDATGSLETPKAQLASSDVTGDDATQSGQMIAEIHKPSHALSAPLLWTEVTK